MLRWNLGDLPTDAHPPIEEAQAALRQAHRRAEDVAQQTTASARAYARQLVHPMELVVTADTRTPSTINRTRGLYVAMELLARVPDLLETMRAANRTTRRYDVADAPLATLHLCEAPGSFIDALKLHLGAALDWHATSLRVARSPLFMSHLLNDIQSNGHSRVSFGQDFQGDLLREGNAAHTVREVGRCRVVLVTADGGEPSDEPLASERRHLPLLCAEVGVALRTLADGGCLLLRVFDLFQTDTHVLLAMLARFFATVELVCPETVPAITPIRYVLAHGFCPDQPGLADALERLHACAFGGPGRLAWPDTWAWPAQDWGARISALAAQLSRRQAAVMTSANDLAMYVQHCGLCTPSAVAEHRQREYDCNPHVLEPAARLCQEIVPVA